MTGEGKKEGEKQSDGHKLRQVDAQTQRDVYGKIESWTDRQTDR